MTVTQRDDFHKKCLATLDSALDRWLICSQWAGRWAGSSSTVIAGYAKALHEDFLACNALGTLEEVHQVLCDRFQGLVKELDTDATNFVTTLAAGSRERVSVYRTALMDLAPARRRHAGDVVDPIARGQEQAQPGCRSCGGLCPMGKETRGRSAPRN